MTTEELAAALAQLGVPSAQTSAMAAQLEKRARQLCEREAGRTYDQALAHLLNLMRQGWAARERGPSSPDH